MADTKSKNPKQPNTGNGKAAETPSKAKAETKSSQKPWRGFHWTPKLEKAIALTVFYVAWVPLIFLLSQYIIAIPMAAFLGDKLLETGWSTLYRILTYLLATVATIFAPPYIIKLVKQLFQTKKSAQKSLPQIEKLSRDVSPNITEMGVQRPPSFIDIGLAPVAYIVYAVFANLFTSLMQFFPWFNPDQAQDVGYSYFITSWDRILAMIALVFVAPVAEELIMRGWLYGKLRSKWGIVLSIILTSIIFGVLHGQWNVGVTVFVLSIILCGMREITGTIWSSMLLHILSNAIAFYFLFVAV